MFLIVVLIPVVIVVIAVFLTRFIFLTRFVITAFRVIVAFGFWGQLALALGLTLSRYGWPSLLEEREPGSQVEFKGGYRR